MTAYASPPAPLAAAIASAAKKYNVPPDLLAGIWRIESGSSYPNPYVNSSGYGGLFGTSNGLASTQAQADESASVLAAGLRASNGNISEALSYYNSGRLSGGYTSVPGQQTFGNVAAPSFQPTSLGTTPAYTRGARPDGGGGFESFLGDAEQGFLSAAGDIPGVSIFESLFGSVSSVSDALKVFLWLFNPVHWLMAFEILFGSLLMVLGLFFLGSEAAGIGSADDIGGPRDVAKTIGLGALIPVAGEARVAKAAAGGRARKQAARAASSRPKSRMADRTAGDKRRAGFTLDVDKPRAKRSSGRGPGELPAGF